MRSQPNSFEAVVVVVVVVVVDVVVVVVVVVGWVECRGHLTTVEFSQSILTIYFHFHFDFLYDLSQI